MAFNISIFHDKGYLFPLYLETSIKLVNRITKRWANNPLIEWHQGPGVNRCHNLCKQVDSTTEDALLNFLSSFFDTLNLSTMVLHFWVDHCFFKTFPITKLLVRQPWSFSPAGRYFERGEGPGNEVAKAPSLLLFLDTPLIEKSFWNRSMNFCSMCF